MISYGVIRYKLEPDKSILEENEYTKEKDIC